MRFLSALGLVLAGIVFAQAQFCAEAPRSCASAGILLPSPTTSRLKVCRRFPHRLPTRWLPTHPPGARFSSAGIPAGRELLITTAFGNVSQIHSVSGPGMDRHQLTFFREGINASTAGAWYAPDGSYFVFSKDSGGGAETMQLFRYDPRDRGSDATDRRQVAQRRAGLVAPLGSDRIRFDEPRRA